MLPIHTLGTQDLEYILNYVGTAMVASQIWSLKKIKEIMDKIFRLQCPKTAWIPITYLVCV